MLQTRGESDVGEGKRTPTGMSNIKPKAVHVLSSGGPFAVLPSPVIFPFEINPKKFT
jgi:hypothetical protein